MTVTKIEKEFINLIRTILECKFLFVYFFIKRLDYLIRTILECKLRDIFDMPAGEVKI